MSVLEQALLDWQKDQTNQFFALLETRLEETQTQQDIVKQKYCAAHFDVSVNTLKEWVLQGCPEIRLDSGMVLYSIQAVRRWLLTYQNSTKVWGQGKEPVSGWGGCRSRCLVCDG